MIYIRGLETRSPSQGEGRQGGTMGETSNDEKNEQVLVSDAPWSRCESRKHKGLDQ